MLEIGFHLTAIKKRISRHSTKTPGHLAWVEIVRIAKSKEPRNLLIEEIEKFIWHSEDLMIKKENDTSIV